MAFVIDQLEKDLLRAKQLWAQQHPDLLAEIELGLNRRDEVNAAERINEYK